MNSSIFYKYEKYWRKKRHDKKASTNLELFDIRCLAQSLLTDEERQLMDDYLFHEEFLHILLEAAKKNDLEKLHETLHESKINVNFYGLDGLTPLHMICKLGHNEILQLLLQRGAQCNMVDKRQGYSPLQICAMHGHQSCIITLLQNNANLAYVNKETTGRNALHYACENGNLSCIKELLSSRELNLVKKNEILKLIQTTLNVQDNDGHTPLHLAVIDGNVACVKLLVESGCDVRMKDIDGRTALSIAQQMNNDAIISLLQQWTPAEYSPIPSVSSHSKASELSESTDILMAEGGGGLFDGCSIIYEAASNKVVFVVVCDGFLVAEQSINSMEKIVVCDNREIAEEVSIQYNRQLNEPHLSLRNRRQSSSSSILKSDMMGSAMNNNSNIFGNSSSPKGFGSMRWGKSVSSDASDDNHSNANSKNSIDRGYKLWCTSNVAINSILPDKQTNSVSHSPSNGKKQCQVIETTNDALLLADKIIYNSEKSLYNDVTNGASNWENGNVKFISQQLEEEDPMWEQYKQQHSKSVVIVSSTD